MAISIGSVNLTATGETQLDWTDRYTWQPVGQTIRYGLAGNPVVIENTRGGRPITLTAELPWGWLTAATVAALDTLASASQTMAFVYGSYSANVRFRRDQGPLQLTPVNSLKTHYTGTISLIEV